MPHPLRPVHNAPSLPRLVPALLVLALAGCAHWGGKDAIPERPEHLKHALREFTPPEPAQYRTVLSNGVPAFIAEDHEFPLVSLSILVRTGTHLDPPGKEGLAALTGGLLRSGGAGKISPRDFDEEADFLAAQISAWIGESQGGASLDCLAKDLDRVLELFFLMLREPAFDPERLDLAKTQALDGMKRRNDATASIEGREWNRLLRGPEHFTSRLSTAASIQAIAREDAAAFHKAYFHPGNFIIAASGDFKKADLLAKLEKHFAGWAAAGPPPPDPPAPGFAPVPGLYVVDKPGVNQGRISIGHLGSTRDDPDRWAIMVMNDILGGGGFTSRIMSRVRSDEGLAYSAGSAFGLGVYYEGVFRAAFQSKSPACARASSIVLEEIARMRRENVTPDELKVSVDSFVESFPRQFANPRAIVSTLADDEYTKRPAGYWREYRKGILAVTPEAVRRSAEKHLHPDRLVILAVGDSAAMLKGDSGHPSFSLEKLSPGGKTTRIPLPDPLTLVYPEAK